MTLTSKCINLLFFQNFSQFDQNNFELVFEFLINLLIRPLTWESWHFKARENCCFFWLIHGLWTPNEVFWPRARSEAVLVKCFFLFVSYFGQKVSCSIRKPKSLILHEKLGSFILNEKSEKSHFAWENWSLSSKAA